MKYFFVVKLHYIPFKLQTCKLVKVWEILFWISIERTKGMYIVSIFDKIGMYCKCIFTKQVGRKHLIPWVQWIFLLLDPHYYSHPPHCRQPWKAYFFSCWLGYLDLCCCSLTVFHKLLQIWWFRKWIHVSWFWMYIILIGLPFL